MAPLTQISLLDEATELHNMVGGPDGLSVRPGFVTALRVEDLGVVQPRSADGTAAQIISGFTVESAANGAIFHYIFAKDSTGVCSQYLYDEEFACLGSGTIGLLTTDDPFSWAVNYNQVVVNSPGLPFPLWGFVGGTLVRAQKVESINPDTPALTLFPGLVCAFADRFVWAYKNQIIVNDPGMEPRTICAPNAVSFGGTVTDIFQAGNGGNLVVVATDATYQIPPDALTGYQLQGVIGKIPGYQSLGRNNAASARGTVLGLSRGGVINIADMSARELVKYRRRRKYTAPVGPGAAGDYRQGAIFAADEGYFIACEGRICNIDIDSGRTAWLYPSAEDLGEPWTGDGRFNLVGLLRNAEGRTLLLLDGAVIDMWGNVDIGQTATVADPVPAESAASGAIAKMLATPPDASPVLRQIVAGGDRPAQNIASFCRSSASATTVPAPQDSPVVGTTLWGAADCMERELRSRRMQRAVRGDSPDLEIRWTGGQTAVAPTAGIMFQGWGSGRPTY